MNSLRGGETCRTWLPFSLSGSNGLVLFAGLCPPTRPETGSSHQHWVWKSPPAGSPQTSKIRSGRTHLRALATLGLATHRPCTSRRSIKSRFKFDEGNVLRKGWLDYSTRCAGLTDYQGPANQKHDETPHLRVWREGNRSSSALLVWGHKSGLAIAEKNVRVSSN